MQKVQEAKKLLLDPEKRTIYDEKLRQHQSNNTDHTSVTVIDSYIKGIQILNISSSSLEKYWFFSIIYRWKNLFTWLQPQHLLYWYHWVWTLFIISLTRKRKKKLPKENVKMNKNFENFYVRSYLHMLLKSEHANLVLTVTAIQIVPLNKSIKNLSPSACCSSICPRCWKQLKENNYFFIESLSTKSNGMNATCMLYDILNRIYDWWPKQTKLSTLKFKKNIHEVV